MEKERQNLIYPDRIMDLIEEMKSNGQYCSVEHIEMINRELISQVVTKGIDEFSHGVYSYLERVKAFHVELLKGDGLLRTDMPRKFLMDQVLDLTTLFLDLLLGMANSNKGSFKVMDGEERQDYGFAAVLKMLEERGFKVVIDSDYFSEPKKVDPTNVELDNESNFSPKGEDKMGFRVTNTPTASGGSNTDREEDTDTKGGDSRNLHKGPRQGNGGIKYSM